MAKVQIKMPEEFLLKLSLLGAHTEDICTKMLYAGGEVVLDKTKFALSKVVGNNTKYPSRSSGELQGALGLSSVKTDKRGHYNIKIGFREPRKDGQSNAKLANILEYGKSNQPAKPFLKPARNQSRKECICAMQQTFDDEVNRL